MQSKFPKWSDQWWHEFWRMMIEKAKIQNAVKKLGDKYEIIK